MNFAAFRSRCYLAGVAWLMLSLIAGDASADTPTVMFDGYAAGQTSAAQAYLQQPVDVIKAFDEGIVGSMVSAQSSTNSSFFVMIVIVAHSDRQDDTAHYPTAEDRRLNELQASTDRGEDAKKWLFSEFCDALRRAGYPEPPDWDHTRNVAVQVVAVGAAALKQAGAPEEIRRKNRRVEFYRTTFPTFFQ